MNYDWEQLGEGVWRTRLPFLDVTVGLIGGRTHALLVDSGTTLAEARGIEADVAALTVSLRAALDALVLPEGSVAVAA